MSEYSICMFAYNEEKHIEHSVNSVFANIDAQCIAVYVIANGCSDNTVPLLTEMASVHAKLHIIDLAIGDKCNAWNHYVHQCAPDVDTHFFVDADVKFSDNAFPRLHARLSKSQANAVAGMPISGRNMDYYRSLVIERSCFFGNLYGVSRRFIGLVKTTPFYLPVGLNWIDSFLTKAVNTDIQFLDDNLSNRVTYLEGCGYYFDSLSPFKLDDLKLYKNRIARYELGKLQEIILDELPLKDWPKDMHSINMQLLEREAWKTIAQPFKRVLVKKRLIKLVNQGPKLPQVATAV